MITLRGSRETVTKGRELFQQLSNRNGGGNIEVVLTINMPPPGPTGFPPYQEIMIPGTKVGLVIGKGGDTIKQLQEKTGAKMVIIQDGPNQEIIVNIFDLFLFFLVEIYISIHFCRNHYASPVIRKKSNMPNKLY